MPILSDRDAICELLVTCPTVAVLGAHIEDHRAACYVPAYLLEHGYRILPVNPRFAGREMFGAPTVASVGELNETIDMIDVFRPAHALPAHLPEILAMDPRPRSVWLQLGIRNDPVAEALSERGITVVQDRCTLADHRAWGLGVPRHP